MKLCEQCGNELGDQARVCGFCGYTQKVDPSDAIVREGAKVINIEEGHPTAEHGIARLRKGLDAAREAGYLAVYIIHGYGSSGVGGKLCRECRKEMHRMEDSGWLHSVVHGEDFKKSAGRVRSMISQCPALETFISSKPNRGVTVAMLPKRTHQHAKKAAAAIANGEAPAKSEPAPKDAPLPAREGREMPATPDATNAAFEAGIKLGALYHQFVGTPVTSRTAPALEDAMAKAMRLQPHVIAARVEILRESIKNNSEGYSELAGLMIKAEVTVQFGKATCIARLAPEGDYPMMRIVSVTGK